MSKATIRMMATACVAVSMLALASSAHALTSPPGQPSSGPGGADYPYPNAPHVSGVGGVGGYTVYEPSPRPESAPVVVVVHGNCVLAILCRVNDVSHVGNQEALMTHLAKKGNVVIYPRYQASSNSPDPTVQVQTAIDGVADALDYLETQPGHTAPDRSRFGIWGQSRGGWVGANMAALLQAAGLPHPDYLAAFTPAEDTESGIPQEDWSTIPSDMYLLSVVGEDDVIAGEGQSRWGAGIIFNDTTTIPLSNKDYVRVNSDTFGTPDLISDHNFPNDNEVDSLDYYVSWKLVGALRDCTGYGTHCDYALGGTSNQEGVGSWSDGTPVEKLCATDDTTETWSQSCSH
jgi:acetyl esterase/lipase